MQRTNRFSQQDFNLQRFTCAYKNHLQRIFLFFPGLLRLILLLDGPFIQLALSLFFLFLFLCQFSLPFFILVVRFCQCTILLSGEIFSHNIYSPNILYLKNKSKSGSVLLRGTSKLNNVPSTLSRKSCIFQKTSLTEENMMLLYSYIAI